MTENISLSYSSGPNDPELAEAKDDHMEVLPEQDATHPLEHTWTLFYDPPCKRTTQENYNTNIQTLASVDSIETTCLVLHNIPNAAELPIGTNLSFFRKGIKPSWEDSSNSKGGKWTCSVSKDPNHTISKLWKESIFACVGNEYPSSDLINGVVLNIRQKTDRIAFWISDASNDETLKQIAGFLKSYLDLPSDHKFSFQLHSDAIKGTSRDYLVF